MNIDVLIARQVDARFKAAQILARASQATNDTTGR
jgi:hypothetical protein